MKIRPCTVLLPVLLVLAACPTLAQTFTGKERQRGITRGREEETT